jgi:hypothetical protein
VLGALLVIVGAACVVYVLRRSKSRRDAAPEPEETVTLKEFDIANELECENPLALDGELSSDGIVSDAMSDGIDEAEPMLV